MTLAAKAALGWLLLFVVMFANGAIRVVILQPQLGENRARQVAVAFELVFGHFVSGLSWSALLADYDIMRGRLWSLILVSVSLGPWFWGAVRRSL